MLVESNRIYLRPFKLSDAASMHALNNNPLVVKYTGDGPFENVEAAREFLENYQDYAIHNCGRWAVIRKEDEKWLGWCGLKKTKDFIDLGYRFFEEEWGKGYATESSILSLDYGFNQLGFKEIIARAVGDNIGSIKVIEKLHMEFWKIEADEYFDNLHHYIMHASKWESVKKSFKQILK